MTRRFQAGSFVVIHQIVSLAGATLILGAYLANQMGATSPRDRVYSLANFLGSLLLLWVAIIDWRVGFIVLEAAWAVISLPHLISPKPAESPAGGTLS
jgi:Na+-translocating ferredoxin:NAD+ oxidoreductase RnfD subunit